MRIFSSIVWMVALVLVFMLLGGGRLFGIEKRADKTIERLRQTITLQKTEMKKTETEVAFESFGAMVISGKTIPIGVVSDESSWIEIQNGEIYSCWAFSKFWYANNLVGKVLVCDSRKLPVLSNLEEGGRLSFEYKAGEKAATLFVTEIFESTYKEYRTAISQLQKDEYLFVDIAGYVGIGEKNYKIYKLKISL